MLQRITRWLIPGGIHYPTEHRRLRLFWWDGVLWNISEAFVLAYSTLYALALGATTAQVGQLTSISNLFGAAALIPGARISEMWGRRKQLVVLFSGIGARLPLLLMALAPLVFEGPAVVYAIMALLAWRTFADNFAKPALTSFTADIVPLRLRGRYFSSRNFAMGMVAFAIVPLAGILIRVFGEPTGYQWGFFIAFLAAAASAVCFARIPEPEAKPAEPRLTARQVIDGVLTERAFLAFTLAGLVWNLSLQVAAPFFNVFLVRELGAGAAMIGFLTALISISGLVGQRWFGRRYHKLGDMGIMRLSGYAIPIFPFIWLVVQAPWQVGIINALSGFFWAGYNLAQFNLLLSLTPERGRERYVAVYQTCVFLAACVAPLVGAWLVEMVGFRFVFALSGLGRLAATVLFLQLITSRRVAAERRGHAAHSSH